MRQEQNIWFWVSVLNIEQDTVVRAQTRDITPSFRAGRLRDARVRSGLKDSIFHLHYYVYIHRNLLRGYSGTQKRAR